MNNQWKKYLFWFAQEHIDFRTAEMQSILGMFGVNIYTHSELNIHPYWIVNLPSETLAHEIASRAVCVRFCLELWANSKQVENLHNKLKTYPIFCWEDR